MKRWRAILSCLLTMVMLTSCVGIGQDIHVNKDGTCGYTITYYYEQSTYELLKKDAQSSVLMAGDFKEETKVLNGKTYEAFSRDFSFGTLAEMQDFLTKDASYLAKLKQDSKAADQYKADDFHAPFKSVTLTSDTFIGDAGTSAYSSLAGKSENQTQVTDVSLQASDLKGRTMNEYYKALGLVIDISITLPDAIKESNGAIEGNKVTWNLDNLPDDMRLIATCGDTPIISGDKEAPKIQGVKNNALTKKNVIVSVTDNVGVKSITVNGKGFGTSQFKLSKDGRYTIKAEDANGNIAVCKVTIDLKAPMIKGVRYGKSYRKKVTLKISDVNGLRYIKINGKKQKAKKKNIVVRRKGKNTVIACDKAGNQTKVVFTIK